MLFGLPPSPGRKLLVSMSVNFGPILPGNQSIAVHSEGAVEMDDVFWPPEVNTKITVPFHQRRVM